MAIKEIPARKICTICDNEIGKTCDGEEFICQTCGCVTCTGELAEDFRRKTHSELIRDKVHLYTRGLGQSWICGPIISAKESPDILRITCDNPDYFEKREQNLLEWTSITPEQLQFI